MPKENKNKVLVAMSGGVDSSVAAALLKKQGYEVVGLNFTLFSSKKENLTREVANILDIPLEIMDVKEEFNKLIVNNFIREYRNGRTPNPCVRCNPFIKLHYLMKKASEDGADHIATGHYARIHKSEINSKFQLLKASDPKKDQAYVLYGLSQNALARTIFPLGDLTKENVRKIARDLDLPVHDKEESQEICFVEDDDYGRFLKEVYPEAVKPGPILDREGNILGRHGGIAFYTLGQRKGIGYHKGLPKYVIEIDQEKNAVVIGNEEDTLGTELIADQMSYVSGKPLEKPLEGTAKIRYNSPEAEAVLYPLENDNARVVFKKPQRAITPGQSVVFYKGDEVIGGGIIK